MKKAVILHGTSSSPDSAWKPWLKAELEKRGYTVWAPLLPDNDRPNRFTYDEFFRNSGWDFTDNLIIGHSSGATAVLNLLSSDWAPHIKTAVLIATHLNDKLLQDVDWYEPEMFTDNFPPEGFNFEKIKTKSDSFYLFHGSADALCDPKDAENLSRELEGSFVLIDGAGHFSSPVAQIPEIITTLQNGNGL